MWWQLPVYLLTPGLLKLYFQFSSWSQHACRLLCLCFCFIPEGWGVFIHVFCFLRLQLFVCCRMLSVCYAWCMCGNHNNGGPHVFVGAADLDKVASACHAHITCWSPNSNLSHGAAPHGVLVLPCFLFGICFDSKREYCWCGNPALLELSSESFFTGIPYSQRPLGHVTLCRLHQCPCPTLQDLQFIFSSCIGAGFVSCCRGVP